MAARRAWSYAGPRSPYAAEATHVHRRFPSSHLEGGNARPAVGAGRPRAPQGNGHQVEPFTYQECIALMDRDGVDRVLIVPPSWEGDRIDYALEACEAYPDRFGVMARIPQDDPVEA